MTRILLLLSFILAAHQLVGQNVVTGIVLDKETGQAIVNVNIQELGSLGNGSASNSKGEFILDLNSVPSQLQFSHISYHDYFHQIIYRETKPLLIYLSQKAEILNEISIVSASEYETISAVESYSIIDYELMEDKIYWVEDHGTFKARWLSIKDVKSNHEIKVELDTFKFVKGLHKSCNGGIYLVTRDYVYPISLIGEHHFFQERLKVHVYNQFIKPCLLNSQDNLIYSYSSFNGLETSYYRYDLELEKITMLRVVSEETAIAHYQKDLGLIVQSENISNIRTNSVAENARIRKIQQEGDFLANVFYKPELKNFILEKGKEIILLNQVDHQIESYSNFKLDSRVEMQYGVDKNWLKEVIIDDFREEVYTMNKTPKGIDLFLISLDTGQSEFITSIEMSLPQYQSIQIKDRVVYFLDQPGGSIPRQILKRKRL